jgi:hypothetical protein
MPKIIIAGDSWGAHSYESGYHYPELYGFKWKHKEKRKYVLYPGPGLYSDDDFYKQGVIKSADKIEYWKKKSEYHRNHPTVATNKRIAQRLYDYIQGTL